MSDHFATLGQPRRPWLEEAALKEAFHRATAQEHPDLAGGNSGRAAALNAAYSVLREPAARLRHLLELEWPNASPAPASIAADLGERFGKIAALRQAAASLARKESAAQSPLARALLAGEQAELRRALEGELATLTTSETVACDDLRTLDARWENHDDTMRAGLADLQQRFAFLAKWQAQLREDLFRLGA